MKQKYFLHLATDEERAEDSLSFYTARLFITVVIGLIFFVSLYVYDKDYYYDKIWTKWGNRVENVFNKNVD